MNIDNLTEQRDDDDRQPLKACEATVTLFQSRMEWSKVVS